MIEIKNAGRRLRAWLSQPASPWFIACGALILGLLGTYAVTTGRPVAASFCVLVLSIIACDILVATWKSNRS